MARRKKSVEDRIFDLLTKIAKLYIKHIHNERACVYFSMVIINSDEDNSNVSIGFNTSPSELEPYISKWRKVKYEELQS